MNVSKEKPVYLIIGEDEYERREVVDRIVAKLLPSSETADGLVRVSSSEINEEHISKMRVLPFFSSSQIFLVSTIDKIKKKGVDLLSAYLDNPCAGTYLILEGAAIDGRSVLFKKVKKAGEFIQLKKVKNVDFKTLVFRRIKDAGRNIEPDALSLLLERSGGSESFLRVSIDKILLSTKNEANISESDVRIIVEKSTSYDAFNLTDALGDKNAGRVMKIFSALLEQGVHELEIIGALCWFFRRLFEGRCLLENGAGFSYIKEAMNIKFYFEKFAAHLKNYTKKELTRILDELFFIDLYLKQGRVIGRPELELLFIKLINGKLV